MKKLVVVFALLAMCIGLNAQDLYGHWEGIITQGRDQFKFELNIEKGSRKDPSILGCRSCRKLKGNIVDYRELEKKIEFFGIVNRDESINLMDSKIVKKEQGEDEIRSRYQIFLEFKGGEPWIIGYWQDYTKKGRKIRQGRIYLKRAKEIASKA